MFDFKAIWNCISNIVFRTFCISFVRLMSYTFIVISTPQKTLWNAGPVKLI
jgi:hypothetical protein